MIQLFEDSDRWSFKTTNDAVRRDRWPEKWNVNYNIYNLYVYDMIRQVPEKWNVIDTTTIYTIYMYMICYSLMFVVEVMQCSRYAMRRCWKLLRARCRSVARLSSFLLDIRGSWEIFQEHKIIHNILRVQGQEEWRQIKDLKMPTVLC